jgi:hypothetical protein
VAILTLCCALAAQAAQASPILTVNSGSIVAGNRQWLVSITPDASLFSGSPPGGSIATEVGFTVGPGSLVSGIKNATNFPLDNPGNSPFPAPINGVQFGVVSSGNNLFAALGSNIFTSATPQQFLTITTLGSGPTKISWLGAYVGNGRIAQGGQNFDTYSGMVSVPEPTSNMSLMIGTTLLVFGRRRHF